MEFNIGKCKSLYYGYGNAMREYTIDNEILQSTDEEKDLGVLMSASLKPSSQCAVVASKAMSALYRSRSTFKYINEESFKILYKTYIRPNLEFCIPAWCPYLSKDIELMEKVQRRATKMVPGLYQRFFEKSTYLSTRHANSCKLVKPSCKKGLQCRSNFFSHRVINNWDKLPEFVISSDSVNSFDLI